MQAQLKDSKLVISLDSEEMVVVEKALQDGLLAAIESAVNNFRAIYRKQDLKRWEAIQRKLDLLTVGKRDQVISQFDAILMDKGGK